MTAEEIRKVLFVCSQNKIRSYTAEQMFQGFDRYQVRSRGTENNARIKITQGDIGWADIIFVMEKRHAERLRQAYPQQLRNKRLITLFVEDIYRAMEPTLIGELKQKLRGHIEIPD